MPLLLSPSVGCCIESAGRPFGCPQFVEVVVYMRFISTVFLEMCASKETDARESPVSSMAEHPLAELQGLIIVMTEMQVTFWPVLRCGIDIILETVGRRLFGAIDERSLLPPLCKYCWTRHTVLAFEIRIECVRLWDVKSAKERP
jgi:hypothetical protein